MLNDTNEKPGIVERYETAGNTSDLTVEGDVRGAGDMLIAAGMATHIPAGQVLPEVSQLRIGMALLRLHSEWSGLAKPKRADPELIRSLAERMPDERGRPDAHSARRAAHDWYVNELRILANGLKSRSTLWRELAPWLARKGIEADTAAGAILHWLDPTCRVCDGLKQRKVVGQPALSAKVCHACAGTGQAHRPKGSGRVLQYMDDAAQRARTALRRRLRAA